jgi:hypothetical protein
MAGTRLIDRYLDELRRQLRLRPVTGRRRFIAEVRAHLVDATEAGMAAGLPLDLAERQAVERFGRPDEISRGWAGPHWWSRAVVALFAACALLTISTAALFTAAQQGLRQGANDPQGAMASVLAAKLATGTRPADLTAGPPVDLQSDPGIHVTVYDAEGRALGSTATLDGGQPTLPPGVREQARTDGIDEVTWQPRPGVRVAAVVVPWSDGTRSGTVIVGRSLHSTEQQVDTIARHAATAWLLSMAVTATIALGWAWRGRSGPPPLRAQPITSP